MSKITVDQLSRLVSGIHDTVINNDAWPKVLATLAHMVGATTGTLVVSRPRSRTLSAVSVGSNPAAVAAYHAHFGSIDPIVRALEEAGDGAVLTPHMVVAPSDMQRQEFFVDWAFPSGVGDGIFANISRDAAMSSSLVLAGPIRNKDLATPASLRLVNLLVPHLKHAVQMQALVETMRLERDSALDTLDRVPYGLVILSADGTSSFANRSALEISEMTDGIAVSTRGVRAAARDADASLQALIARVSGDRYTTGSSGMVRVRRPSGRRAFVVLVIPFTRSRLEHFAGIPGAPAALVAIIDPEHEPRLPADVLEDLFDLTPAEAAVSLRILSCDGLQSVADSLGVTLSTVRIHLQRVFEKTGVHRQSELVRLLLEVLPAISIQTSTVARDSGPRAGARRRYRRQRPR